MNTLLVAPSQNDNVNNVISGWANAFASIGHRLVIWDHRTPIFRVFHEFQPTEFILSPESITNPVMKACDEFKVSTFILFDDPKFQKHISDSYEVGILSEMELEEKQHHVPYGVDIISYGPDKKDDRYISEFAYVGRYNPKAQTLYAEFGDKLRIYSPDPHNHVGYVGFDNNKPAIFASVTKRIIAPNTTDELNVKYSQTGICLQGKSYHEIIANFLNKLNIKPELQAALLEKLNEKNSLHS